MAGRATEAACKFCGTKIIQSGGHGTGWVHNNVDDYRACGRFAEPEPPQIYNVKVPAPYDSVSKPAHYNRGKIDTRDFITDQKLNYNRGAAIKYVVRAGFKDPTKEIEDLEKAVNYLQHEITVLRG